MLLDTTKFPLVFLREDGPQAAGQPADLQLQALLERGEPFVLLTDHLPGDHPDEGPEERKQRALFFKRNKERMRQLCKGMVIITGDRPIPAAVRLAARGAGKALGMAVAFVHGESDALTQSAQLLESASLPRPA